MRRTYDTPWTVRTLNIAFVSIVKKRTQASSKSYASNALTATWRKLNWAARLFQA